MLTRELIIRTAFQEWSAARYYTTSLSTLAKALGVSKPALYRHFRSKDDLLLEMEKTLAARYEEAGAAFIARSAGAGLPETIGFYCSTVLRFFAENPNYLWFLFHHAVTGRISQVGVWQELTARIAGLIAEKAAAHWPQRGAVYIASLAEHIPLAGGTLLATLLEKNALRDEADVERSLVLIRRLLIGGFSAVSGKEPADLKLPDFRRLSREVEIPMTEMLAPDRLFTAISDVVAKEGLMGASVEKIAEQLGITKSSLYFHFENKDEMLYSFIIREFRRKGELVSRRIGEFRTFEDRLAAYMLASMHYFMNNTSMLTSFRWVWHQRIPVKLEKREHDFSGPEYDLLEDGIREGKIDAGGLDVMQIVRFLNFLLIRTVMERGMSGQSREETSAAVRWVCRLFLYGIR